MCKERFGQMVQMDGSHHAWFENRGRKCCLIVTIDDATGEVRGRFYSGETLFAARLRTCSAESCCSPRIWHRLWMACALTS